MCRLFGFRSATQSQVHQSLLHAENALLRQSAQHPDGWGVAYYHEGAPHIIKSADTACHNDLYVETSNMVSSRTVLAHIRKATAGAPSVANTHPFQYGPWVFAHNGKIADFDARRALLVARVDPTLQAFILGDTDSECFFYLILSYLSRRVDLADEAIPLHAMAAAAEAAIADIYEIAGGQGSDETLLTFILTNGVNMLAHQGGKELHVSTYKTRCSRRQICPQLTPACEHPSHEGPVTHFILSSEPLLGENVWRPLEWGEFLAVDARMQVYQLPRYEAVLSG